MRKSFKSVVAGVAALCVAGVISAVGATSASAATQPFDPTQDANWVGTVTIYDAAGHVVTSGDSTNPLSAQYMVGSVTPAGATSVTSIRLYNPQPSVNPGLWSGVQTNGNTPYPILTAPAVVSSATTPQGAQLVGSNSFTGAIGSGGFIPNTGALTNVFQIRLQNSGGGGVFYNATTITIDPITHVWQQVDPAVADSTKTVLTQSGTSGGTAPQSDTLTATVSRTAGTQAPVPAGNVQFMNGTTAIGSPVAVNASGVATLPQAAVPAGTYPYNAVFTPTAPTVWITSTSAPVAFVVKALLPTPAVALTATSVAPNLGSPVTFTANVAPIATVNVPGTVQFFDGTTSLAPAAAADATGMATLTTSALTLGAHSVTATFVPTDLTTYNGNTSPALAVNVVAVAPPSCSLPGSSCTDAQNFQATVPAGSIVISTPYHAGNPFNIGTMVLNAAGNQYTTSNLFGNAANPTNGVTITDTRAGGLGWTASLQSGAFANTTGATGVINAGNLGFTGVAPQYINGNALNVAPGNVVSVFDNVAPTLALAPLAAASGLANPQKFASALVGAGSVNVTGLFTLHAPSSTPAGVYGGIVTFTIA
jgi:hypothetical protein